MSEFSAIRSALILTQPWADLVVSGAKRWELRSKRTRKRERVGIIAKGTGTIIGTVVIADCSGPLTDAQLEATERLHLLDKEMRLAHPTWCFAWRLAEATRFSRPQPYRHLSGAQSWVTLKYGVELAAPIAGC